MHHANSYEELFEGPGSAAIEDALEPYGVRITSLPITAEQIVEWASSH